MKVRWLERNLTEEAFLHRIFGLGDNLSLEPEAELFIYSGIQREASSELKSVARSGRVGRRILVHLSDEKLRHRNSVYSAFDVVFRNYFDPRLAWRRNVVFLPLGWTSAFREYLLDVKASPSRTWSFCGAIKADRELMVNRFSKVSGGFHHFSSGWNSRDQIPPESVLDIYRDSLFVLCPQGNAHVDTFRVMEALQAGAIPVSTRFLGRDFFRYTFGDHPFVVEKNWSAAMSQVERLLAEPQEALAYRQRVQDWYIGYLRDLETLIAALITGRMNPSEAMARNRHVARSRFDVVLMVAIAQRFRSHRRVNKPRNS